MRKQNRIEKLGKLNRYTVEKRIAALTEKKSLTKQETAQLEALKDDLEFMISNKLGGNEKEDLTGPLGKKSIFYDEEWNPEGLAPPYCKNVKYNHATFVRRSVLKPRLADLHDIKLP